MCECVYAQSMSSTFEPDTKHAITLKASYGIIQEIYRYRTRSGVYQPGVRNEALQAVLDNAQQAIPGDITTKKATSSEPEDKVSTEPRIVFWEQTQSIYKQVQTSGLALDDLQEPPQSYKEEVAHSLFGSSSSFRKASLYLSPEMAASSLNTAVVHPILDESFDAPTSSSIDSVLGEEERKDDGCSMLTAEDYFQFRLQPAMRQLQAIRPVLTRKYYTLRVLELLATMVAGIFGFIGLQIYIPVMVAVVASLEGLSNFWHVRQKLTDVSLAMSNLEELTLWWGCLSRTQRRLHQSKNYLVDTTETAIASQVNCYGGAVAPTRRAEVTGESEKI